MNQIIEKTIVIMLRRAILLAGLLVLVTACGGGSDTNTSSSVTRPTKASLASQQLVKKQISALSGLEKINAQWLVGKWASFDNLANQMLDKTYHFSSDGRFTYQSLLYSKTNKKTDLTGTWEVYKKSGSNRHVIVFTTNVGSISSVPIEQEGSNAFRLVLKSSRPVAGSALFARLNSKTPAIYPGMGFLGTYRTTFNGRSHKYFFKKDGSVEHSIFESKLLNPALLSTEKGSWSLQNFQLVTRFNGATTRYSMDYANTNLFRMTPAGGATQDWRKTGFISVVGAKDLIVGEYRSRNDESYISVRATNTPNRYRVDMVSQFGLGTRLFGLSAQKLKNGNLSIVLPQNSGFSNQVVEFRAKYNRLQFLKRPSTFLSTRTFFEKISKFTLAQKSQSIAGAWTNSLSHSSGYKGYQHFLDDGTFIDTGLGGDLEYGKYRIENNQLISKKVCQATLIRNISFRDHHLLLNNITFSPIPTIRNLGHEGSAIDKILLDYDLDNLQRQKGAKLVKHPTRKGAFLFAKTTKFDAGNTKFVLKSDGSGDFFSGIVKYYIDIYTGHWVDTQTSGGTFKLKYFVIKEGEKEYLVFHYKGAFFGNFDGEITRGNANENIKDARIAELYHGRTALCYQYSTVKNSAGLVMPLRDL